MVYRIKKREEIPPLSPDPESPFWKEAERAAITNFRPEGTVHRPAAEASLLWSPEALHILFRVEDRYIRAVTTEFQGPVYEDSCVEFFLRPHEGGSYFNMEFNCIGTLSMYCISDPVRTETGFKAFKKVSPADAEGITISTTYPKGVPIRTEITQAAAWGLQVSVPFPLLNNYLEEKMVPEEGLEMTGNFFKCGDKTSHPHWGSWSEVGGSLNFHQPAFFGKLILA